MVMHLRGQLWVAYNNKKTLQKHKNHKTIQQPGQDALSLSQCLVLSQVLVAFWKATRVGAWQVAAGGYSVIRVVTEKEHFQGPVTWEHFRERTWDMSISSQSGTTSRYSQGEAIPAITWFPAL